MHVIVRLGELESLNGLAHELSAIRVELLRAIKREGKNIVLHIIEDGVEGHSGSPCDDVHRSRTPQDARERESPPQKAWSSRHRESMSSLPPRPLPSTGEAGATVCGYLNS